MEGMKKQGAGYGLLFLAFCCAARAGVKKRICRRKVRNCATGMRAHEGIDRHEGTPNFSPQGPG